MTNKAIGDSGAEVIKIWSLIILYDDLYQRDGCEKLWPGSVKAVSDEIPSEAISKAPWLIDSYYATPISIFTTSCY